MIIVCPACETRFLVDDSALGVGERRVRCANCGNLWVYSRVADEIAKLEADEPVLIEPAAGPQIAPLRADPRPADAPAAPSGPPAMPRLVQAVIPSLQSGQGMAAAALIVFTVIVLGAIAVFGAVAAQNAFVAFWGNTNREVVAQSATPSPATSPPPASAPLAGDAAATADAKPGTGLKVTVNPSRTSDSLVIDGNVVNSGTVPRPVPRLRLTLRDAKQGDLASKVVDPAVGRLPPGGTTHFSAIFEHPSAAASKVDVTFATD